MNNRSKSRPSITALGDEFSDPSCEVKGSVILALPSKAINSVYVASVITPTSPSAINSEAVFTEIVNDESFKTGPLCFLWICHRRCLHLFG